jgi:CheY-like chemotaxis protein
MTDHEDDKGRGGDAGRTDRLRIFYVEDEPATRQVFLRILRLHGYDVRSAGTYQEAITLADGQFDLILSDIALPDGSGWDVMRHIRLHWGEIPGIALSGFGSEQDVSTSRAAGFAIHLTKPVPFPQLKATIELIGRRGVRPD